MEKKHNYDDPKALLSFLYVITKNACIDLQRTKGKKEIREKTFALFHAYNEKLDLFTIILNNVEFSNLVEAIIIRLPKRTQEIFTFTFREGIDNKNIAKKMGINLRTVQRERALIQAYLESSFFQNRLKAICSELVE